MKLERDIMTLKRSHVLLLMIVGAGCLVLLNSPNFSGRSLDPTSNLLNHENNSDVVTISNVTVSNRTADPIIKTILYYTTLFNVEDFGFGIGQKPFLKTCEINQCLVTNDKGYFADFGDFDAVLFHPLDMINDDSELVVPTLDARRPHQRFVMFMREAPLSPERFFYGKYSVRRRSFNYSSLNGFFNWTMTYRLDSDIPIPHGWIDPKGPGMARNRSIRTSDLIKWRKFDRDEFRLHMESNHFFKQMYLNRRRGLVAFLVSHCWTNSNREGFVAELAKHVRVDVLGGCSDEFCNAECYLNMKTNYKFVLAFENNLCKHYVTEKFWATLGMVVPIVIGNHDHYKEFAPPHSYIHAGRFPSVKALADYLLYLDANNQKYASYFWWRIHYAKTDPRNSLNFGMCELCKMLHNKSEPTKVVSDLQEWWWTQSECKPFPKWR